METTEWPGVFRHGRELFTVSLDPGHRVYGEEVRVEGGKEFRRWDPFRSKLAAYLLKAPPAAPWERARTVLYLGGAHGTTVSHLSDLLPDARLVVVEKSPVAFASLLALARRRSNVHPILADAQLPERYRADVGAADLIYQDVAQRDQARLFLENWGACRSDRARGLLMLKVRSVTQSRPAERVLAEARAELERGGLTVRGRTDLGPFSRDHAALTLSPA